MPNRIGLPAVGQLQNVTASSSLSLVLPALRHVSEHHLRERDAIIAAVAEFIVKTEDGSVAVLLADALKDLPQVNAYAQDLLAADELFAVQKVVVDERVGADGGVGHGDGRWSRGRCMQFLREVYDDPTYGDSKPGEVA